MHLTASRPPLVFGCRANNDLGSFVHLRAEPPRAAFEFLRASTNAGPRGAWPTKPTRDLYYPATANDIRTTLCFAAYAKLLA